MITIRLQGGLGNQMFQYAFGLYLKKILNADIQFDISFYDQYKSLQATPRELELDVFCVSEFKKVRGTFLPNSLLSKINRFLKRKLLPYYLHDYVKEQKREKDDNLKRVGKGSYLDGYWQNVQYLQEVQAQLSNEFILKVKLSEKAIFYSHLILNSKKSISIHVRRDDYIKNYSDIFCILDADYYQRAIQKIITLTDDISPSIFVFSQDMEWCRQNISSEYHVVYVDSKQMHSYEDMLLMSMCHYNIIANSTYSWWGAWLNKNQHKCVVAPKHFYVNQPSNFLSYFYPSEWIIL